MNEIVLKKMILKNFKGVKDLTIDFGEKTSIEGDNATGKTTVFDSFCWLLFDKDSQDRKDFEIKTLDSNNEVIHGLEHTVTGVLEINEKPITLVKTFKEKWTKRRGEAEKQFTGHETLYYIDEVPVKKSEYQDKINSIIDENLFKLISNPLYFNGNMKWQDRRNVILDIVGDITEESVINYKSELKPLLPLLEDKDIDTLKRSVAARRKKLNDDIKSIPFRIDECNNSIQEHDWKALEQELQTQENDLKEIEDTLLDAGKVTKDALDQQAQLYGLKTRIQAIEYVVNKDKDKPLMDLKSKLQKAEYELKTEENKFNNLLEKRSICENTVIEVTEQNNQLRAEWHEINKKALKFDESKFVCPVCNRPFEEHDIEAKKVEMAENFNLNKAKELSAVGNKGKNGKRMIDKLKEDIESIEEEIEKAKLQLTILGGEKENLEDKIANFKPVDTLNTNREYQNLKKEVDYMEALIAEEAATETNTSASTLKGKKKEITAKIDDIKRQLVARENNATIQVRIADLMDQERSLSEQIAKIEGQEFLCEEFIKTKVELMESSINNKFKLVNFKLFDIQINGGLNECCTAMVNGVPFESLNSAAKINAGLDIINTLSEHYEVESPIFIDNAESINDILETNSQMICLTVSQDKELKINREEREVA
jgi:Rad50 zinc hook motif.